MPNLTAEQKNMLKRYGQSNYAHAEGKVNWEIGCVVTPDTELYFKTISSKPIDTIQREGGLDPRKRSEVNWAVIDGSDQPIVFPGMGAVFKFIYAFPSETNDSKWNRALEHMGWLPEKEGQTTFMHSFKVPGLTPYVSDQAKISASAEIAFPVVIEPGWIKASWQIERKKGRYVPVLVS
jgi:hypothetical protein